MSLLTGSRATFRGVCHNHSEVEGGTGTAYGPGQVYIQLANNTSTRTVANEWVIATGSPSTATVALTSTTSGVLGICTSGCSASGTATIQNHGLASCVFDGGVIAGDYVTLSTSNGGRCHDAGTTYPTSGLVLGRVLSATSGSAGTYTINIYAPDTVIAGGGAGIFSTLTGASSGPPVLNELASLNSSAQATIATAGATSGVLGICTANCTSGGNATIQIMGTAPCVFTGGVTAGHYAQIDSSANGKCSDGGATYPSGGGEVLGEIVSPTNGTAGTYNVSLFGPQTAASGSSISLANYSGNINSTGNQTNGNDQFAHVNWDGVIDPRTYGAVCDGTTDDTSAFSSAIANGRSIEIPQGKVCAIVSNSACTGSGTPSSCCTGSGTGTCNGPLTINGLTGLTIFGHSRLEQSGSSGTVNSGTTGLKFLGTPASCSGGSGGRLNIKNSYAITLHDMTLWFDTAGNDPNKCEIYPYTSQRVTLERLQITNPYSDGGTAVNTTAIQAEQNDESTIDNNYLDQGFARALYVPATSGNYYNRNTIMRDRVGSPTIAFGYSPIFDFETGSSNSSCTAVNEPTDCCAVFCGLGEWYIVWDATGHLH
jgi:hypothetical protein